MGTGKPKGGHAPHTDPQGVGIAPGGKTDPTPPNGSGPGPAGIPPGGKPGSPAPTAPSGSHAADVPSRPASIVPSPAPSPILRLPSPTLPRPAGRAAPPAAVASPLIASIRSANHRRASTKGPGSRACRRLAAGLSFPPREGRVPAVSTPGSVPAPRRGLPWGDVVDPAANRPSRRPASAPGPALPPPPGTSAVGPPAATAPHAGDAGPEPAAVPAVPGTLRKLILRATDRPPVAFRE